MTTFSIVTLVKEARRRRVILATAMYTVGAWVALQVADLAFPAFDIPESAIRYVWSGAILLFPLAVVFGWRYDVTTKGIVRTPPVEELPPVPLAKTDLMLLATLSVMAVAIVMALGFRIAEMKSTSPEQAAARELAEGTIETFLDEQAEIRRAKDELMPKIRSLLDVRWSDYTEPYGLAVKAEGIIPDDPELREVFQKISLRINVDSEPAGADVHMKVYKHPEAEWIRVGTTPIVGVRVPVGIFRWKFEKEGYATVEAAASSWDASVSGKNLLVPNNFSRKLDRIAEIPEGMVRVAGAKTPHGEVKDFFIDRHEVTNAAFQQFVDSDGYSNKDYWQHEFIGRDRALTWDEGIARFVDQTGRPGPSSWLGGTYPDGLGKHPVSGVSWYEAAAYAEYVGKVLPTGTHWGMARGEYSPLIKWPQLGGFAVFAPFSNFGGNGTVDVGSLPGVTAYGAYDLAGNVREWCSNDAPLGKLVRGGAWSDNSYRFAELSQGASMMRDPGYGFRTALYPDGALELEAVFASVTIKPQTDLDEEEIVSDEVFEVFRRQFDYDELELNSRQESLDDSFPLWTLERVSVDTPYGDDRMIINLFLPKNASPPYQAVIYIPGSASFFQTSSEKINEYYEFPVFLSYLVKTGRAVAYPVFPGTFERSDQQSAGIFFGRETRAYSEFVIDVIKDFRRTIDYLETREDIDSERLALYGMSWGSMIGLIAAAVDHRPKTAVVMGGHYAVGHAESNLLNYAPRVTMPVLSLVGRYDSLLSHETSTKPLFDLIGTPNDQKMMKVYETDHIPPKNEYIVETLKWLDLYLGPVGEARLMDTPAAAEAN
jgi:dienelactone hydrolase